MEVRVRVRVVRVRVRFMVIRLLASKTVCAATGCTEPAEVAQPAAGQACCVAASAATDDHVFAAFEVLQCEDGVAIPEVLLRHLHPA